MKKNFMKTLGLLVSVFLVFGVLSSFSMSSASAIEPSSGSEVVRSSTSSSADEAQVVSTSHAGGTITAKTVAYVKATGTPKSQQTNCTTLKKATSLWTSYKNSLDKEVWHWKYYPKGKRFCKIGGVMRDPVCHNKVKIGVPKAKKPKGIIITGKIKVIKAFKFVATAQAKVTVTSTVSAKAWCSNEWTSQTSTASASAEATAYAKATASGSTSGFAQVSAKGAAKKFAATASFKSKVEADAYAKATAKAKTAASTTVTCNEGPPSYSGPTASASANACVQVGQQSGVITVVGNNPNGVAANGTISVGGQSKSVGTVSANGSVTTTFSGFAPGTYSGTFTLGAPVNKSVSFTVTVNQCDQPSGSLVELEQPNDVLINNTRTIRVRGTVSAGQSFTLKSSSIYGNIATADKSIVVTGSFDVLLHYTAPSEVPAGAHDTVKVQLFAPSGTKTDEASVSFVIQKPVPDKP